VINMTGLYAITPDLIDSAALLRKVRDGKPGTDHVFQSCMFRYGRTRQNRQENVV